MADRKINAVMSTSAGRLFDGVSAILGIRRKSTFEGEASMALEFAAEEYRKHYVKRVRSKFWKLKNIVTIKRIQVFSLKIKISRI